MTTDDSRNLSIRLSLKLLVPTLLAAVFVSGCMPQANDASGGAEAYEYKGKADPLMSEPAADRAAKLSERFKLIQARQ